MSYINTETLEYPLSEADIRRAFPNTSFPTPFQPPEGYAPVLESPTPTYNSLTQGYRELTPAEDSLGNWMRVYEVYDLDAEQIQYNKDQLAQQKKQQGKQLLLDTDWASIPSIADPAQSNPYLANQAEFLAYRSAVRSIVLNPTYDAVFPEQPEEQWSTE